jgi:hypothetical protein
VKDPPLLSSVLPQFAAEVASALTREHPELASQVEGLRIGSFCGCSDPGCMTFDIPGRRRSDYSFSIELEELSGLVIVDVAEPGRVRGALAGSRPRIIGIETLERPELRKQVDDNPEVGRSRGLPL